jgi:hypothetical protein
MAVFDESVRLPWDTILMDSLNPADPEDREVIGIIERVQQKGRERGGTLANFDEESSQRVDSQPVFVTKPLNVDSARVSPKGGRPRKYTSRAAQQAAYRERKAAIRPQSTAA